MMKKIIFLFIVFLAFFHPLMSNAKEVGATVYNFSNQEQTTSFINHPATQADFISTDLLELTEDEISHFEKKFLPAFKISFYGDKDALAFSKAVLHARINLTSIYINLYSSYQSFLGNYRI